MLTIAKIYFIIFLFAAALVLLIGCVGDIKSKKIMENEYIPYGPEWEKEMMKMNKTHLVGFLKKWSKKNRDLNAFLEEHGLQDDFIEWKDSQL